MIITCAKCANQIELTRRDARNDGYINAIDLIQHKLGWEYRGIVLFQHIFVCPNCKENATKMPILSERR